MKKGEGLRSQKLLRIGLKWCFSPMKYKSNVSCLPKKHILCFMALPSFARFLLRDTPSISFKIRKKGRRHQKIKCVYPLYFCLQNRYLVKYDNKGAYTCFCLCSIYCLDLFTKHHYPHKMKSKKK